MLDSIGLSFNFSNVVTTSTLKSIYISDVRTKDDVILTKRPKVVLYNRKFDQYRIGSEILYQISTDELKMKLALQESQTMSQTNKKGNKNKNKNSRTSDRKDPTLLENCLHECSKLKDCSLAHLETPSITSSICKLIKIIDINEIFYIGMRPAINTATYIFDRDLGSYLRPLQVSVGRNFSDENFDHQNQELEEIGRINATETNFASFRKNVDAGKGYKLPFMPMFREVPGPKSEDFDYTHTNSTNGTSIRLFLNFNNKTKIYPNETTANIQGFSDPKFTMLGENYVIHDLDYHIKLNLDLLQESSCILTYFLSKVIKIHQINLKYSRKLDCLKLYQELAYAKRLKASSTSSGGNDENEIKADILEANAESHLKPRLISVDDLEFFTVPTVEENDVVKVSDSLRNNTPPKFVIIDGLRFYKSSHMKIQVHSVRSGGKFSERAETFLAGSVNLKYGVVLEISKFYHFRGRNHDLVPPQNRKIDVSDDFSHIFPRPPLKKSSQNAKT